MDHLNGPMDLFADVVYDRLIVFDRVDRRDHRRNADFDGRLGGIGKRRKNGEEEE